MARTADEISRSIRASLRILDPDISVEPLTPERKIVDTVSEVIASADIDTYVLNYQFNIDTKSGQDLDRFVALFGFSRQRGRRSTGSVTFSRNTAATQDIVIPTGTQVLKPATTVTPAVVFRTTTSATIYIGTTEADCPIESTIVGQFGNVPANTITQLATGGSVEVSGINNPSPTTGGSAQETDAELRLRFKNTVFRNITGTKDQFLALAIASRFANKANVIGPLSRFIEYVQIANNTPSGGLHGAVSVIPYSKYTYGFDYYLTDGNPTAETFFTPRGVQYTFNSTLPPSITVADLTNLPDGKVVLREHSYCSANSRNDPANNVGNYVDVYVSGEDLAAVTESALFPTSANNFTATTTSPFYTGNFKRYPSNVTPTAGNRFQELLWQPADSLPSSITISATTYTLNTDYWFVKDTTVYKGSRRARNGIEWKAASIAGITAGTLFGLSYTFDRLPLTLNETMEAHKQVGTDVLVHSATERFLRVHMVIMYSPGFSTTSVNAAIETALSDFLERQQFGAVIQVSDILNITHDVPGVDNVRLTTSTDDAVNYGIQEIAADGTTFIGSSHTTDFALQDSDLPVLSSIVTIQKSQNTWG
jgi:uncharacterized phage protein gp47/JayE